MPRQTRYSKRSTLTVEQQVYELQLTRRLLQAERSNLAAKNRSLAAENFQLRIEKKSLLNYIKELEMFLPHKETKQEDEEI